MSRGSGREFSRIQKFVAAVYAYASLPPEARLGLARDYAAQVAADEVAKATAAAEPRPAKKDLLADLKAKKHKAVSPG
jgi:hypothetical protein